MLPYLCILATAIAASASIKPSHLIRLAHKPIQNDFSVSSNLTALTKPKIQSNVGSSQSERTSRAARCHGGRYINALGQCVPCTICIFPNEIVTRCGHTSDTICSQYGEPSRTIFDIFQGAGIFQVPASEDEREDGIGLVVTTVSSHSIESHTPKTLESSEKHLKRRLKRCRRKSQKCKNREKSCVRKRRKRCLRKHIRNSKTTTTRTTVKTTTTQTETTNKSPQCPAGNFINEFNRCSACTDCSLPYVEVTPCRRRSDTVCALSVTRSENATESLPVLYQDKDLEIPMEVVPTDQTAEVSEFPKRNIIHRTIHNETFSSSPLQNVDNNAMDKATGRQRQDIGQTKQTAKIPVMNTHVAYSASEMSHSSTRGERLERAAQCHGGLFLDHNGHCRRCTYCIYPSEQLAPCKLRKDRVCSTPFPLTRTMPSNIIIAGPVVVHDNQNRNTEIPVDDHRRVLTTDKTTPTSKHETDDSRDRTLATNMKITSKYPQPVAEEQQITPDMKSIKEDPETEMMKSVYIVMLILIMVILLYIVIALLFKFSDWRGCITKQKGRGSYVGRSSGDVAVNITPPIPRRSHSTEGEYRKPCN